MSTSRRCSIKEDLGGSITYRQCRRRSHPVQQMGGVCAICLTERLSNIARCAEPASGPPQLTDRASCGYPCLAGAHSQSMDSEGIAPIYINMSKQGNISAQQCDNSIGMQDLSARDSSAGSEQSIASLIEREIDEGRQRYSDVTAGSKELESSNDRLAAAAYVRQAQLVRSRSYSTNSHFNSIQSTPPSCKSNSSLRNCGDSCTTSSNFRRYDTAAVGKSRDLALLTKSKSTGSNYNGNNRHASRLRSPIHVPWSLPNFWHKKCTHMERRHDASSSHDHSSMIVQADDSVPFMKLPRSCSKNAVANCMGIRWSSLRSFYLTHRSSTSGKGSGTSTCAIRRSSSSSSACTHEEPLTMTQDVASSSSSTAARSNCSANLQVVDDDDAAQYYESSVSKHSCIGFYGCQSDQPGLIIICVSKFWTSPFVRKRPLYFLWCLQRRVFNIMSFCGTEHRKNR